MLPNNVITRLGEIFGTENVLTKKDDLAVYSYDATPFIRKFPTAVIIPGETNQISELMQLANTHGFAVIPRGSGTGLSGGSVPENEKDAVILLMSQKNRILEIDQINMTALVEPGVITGEFQQEVEKYNLFYPPDPGSSKICTIGGNVAENAGGIRGLKYGVTRNYVMGIEAVLPDGKIIWSGNKCIKDVAGYSLKDLFIGSEGTLGIFTKILLRLIPKPESARTIFAAFKQLSQAATVIGGIFEKRIFPSMLEIIDNTTLRCIEGFAKLNLPLDAEALLLIEVDGKKSQTEEESRIIFNLCKENESFRLELARDAEHAEELKAARRSAFAALARAKPTTIMEDIAVPRDKLAEMMEYIHSLSEQSGIMVGTFGHAGDGNLHPTVLTDERDKDEIEKAWEVWKKIMQKAIQLGGTITGEHGVGSLKRRYLPEGVRSDNVEIMQILKNAFDPNNVLNPGKVI